MDHEITLPIPVEACNPYAKGCLDQVASAEHLPIAHGAVDHLVLSIGVVPLRGAIELRRGAPYQEIRLLPSELPFGKQSILQCSLRLIERVAVLDYGLPTGAQPSETGSESL